MAEITININARFDDIEEIVNEITELPEVMIYEDLEEEPRPYISKDAVAIILVKHVKAD